MRTLGVINNLWNRISKGITNTKQSPVVDNSEGREVKYQTRQYDKAQIEPIITAEKHPSQKMERSRLRAAWRNAQRWLQFLPRKTGTSLSRSNLIVGMSPNYWICCIAFTPNRIENGRIRHLPHRRIRHSPDSNCRTLIARSKRNVAPCPSVAYNIGHVWLASGGSVVGRYSA